MVKQKIVFYEWLAVAFVTILILSNISSIKMVSIGPIVFDAGTILFPLAYIIGDIITEVYGYRRMRGLIAKGIIMLLAMSLTFWIVGMLPAEASWTLQESFTATLGVVWRIVAASIVAVFVGELMNSYVLAKLKIATKGKGLWGRLIGSSAVGNAFDTVIFSVIAFAGTMPFGVLVQLIVSVFIIKMVVEIAISPLTVLIIRAIKKREKIDTYEDPTLLS